MAHLAPKGKIVFQDYYRQYFANDVEFQDFLRVLSTPTHPILRFSPENESKLKPLWEKYLIPWETLPWYPHALTWPKGYEKVAALPGAEDFLFYPQNASSLLPVLALDPKPGETILDACAAPGGKALFIAERMQGKGELIANDLSRTRRTKMGEIVRDYGFASFIKIMGRNATSFAKSHPEHFDKILLDAPCSSEKHVWNSPKHLSEWKPGRIRHLRKLQFVLLRYLFKALKPGGRLVYSTCSVASEENEALIARFLEKFEGEIVSKNLPDSFPHENGRIHPHHCPGMDPMFVAILEKDR